MAEFFIGLINLIIKAIGSILSTFLNVLPDSPFSVDALSNLNITEYLSYLSWFVPIGAIINITLAWCGAILVYYGLSIILRFIKIIE